MNAAARLVHQGLLTRHLLFVYLLTRRQISMLLLTLGILLSALSIIYITHVNRLLHAHYQHQLKEQNRLHIQHGQLLLERGTWIIQSRIQQLAESKLGMMLPAHQSVVIIHE